MKTIRWGMIGCGDVTEVRSGPAFQKAKNSQLVAVMRRNGALAQDYAKRHNIPRWHDDADAIINDPNIDAVYIATLTDTHCDYVLRCIAAGKAVYCEKPMAMNYAQCCEMIGASRASKMPLWIAFYRRALPRFLKIKELVENGAIGKARIVMSRQFARADAHWATMNASDGQSPWRVDPARSGGGLFFETACHTFDFLDFLFGPIVELNGLAVNQAGAYRAEDTASASYRFESGVLGSGGWCYTADHAYEMNEIVGESGRILFSTTKAVPIRLHRGDAMEEFNVGDPPHVHQPLVQSIVDELNGSGTCPSTGDSAARTVWVMDRLLADYYPGRDRVRAWRP
jgi:predicted dehydrogenase